MNYKCSHCENCHVIYGVIVLIVVPLLMLGQNLSCLG